MLEIASQALVAVVALAAALALVTWSVLTRPRVDKQLVRNLQRSLYGGERQQDSRQGPSPRLQALAQRLTPASAARRLESLWSRAGRPAAWPVQRLLVAKLVLPVTAAVLSALYLSSRAT